MRSDFWWGVRRLPWIKYDYPRSQEPFVGPSKNQSTPDSIRTLSGSPQDASGNQGQDVVAGTTFEPGVMKNSVPRRNAAEDPEIRENLLPDRQAAYEDASAIVIYF